MFSLKGRLGFGTSHLHRVPSADRQALLAAAYENGLRHFDTARLYGYGIAERELGRFISGRRDEITLATKVGYRFPFFSFNSPLVSRCSKLAAAAEKLVALKVLHQYGPDYVLERRDLSLSALSRSLSASLKALRTDYVDVLLLHEFEASVCSNVSEIVGWLTKLKSDGVIRAYGISAERTRCLAAYETFPQLCELMQASDPFNEGIPILDGIPGFRPRVTYGYFRGARLDRLSLAQRIEYAIGRNRDGMILFSSTKVDNVRTFVEEFRARDVKCSTART